MARPGRPPKITETRSREGGTARNGAVSHRPIQDLVTVAGRNVPTAAPADLPEHAQELWEEIVRVLAEAGIIDAIDLPMLRSLTVQYARARQAAMVLDEPLTDEEIAELRSDLRTAEVIENALQTKIAGLLQGGISPPATEINALANYSSMVANKRAYMDALVRAGRVVALGSTGQLIEHPLIATERAAASLLLRFASEYAMTPVARAKLGIVVLAGRSIAQELEDDLGVRRKGKTVKADPVKARATSTTKKPGSGRKPRTKTAEATDA